jgi:hypothetical protein
MRARSDPDESRSIPPRNMVGRWYSTPKSACSQLKHHEILNGNLVLPKAKLCRVFWGTHRRAPNRPKWSLVRSVLSRCRWSVTGLYPHVGNDCRSRWPRSSIRVEQNQTESYIQLFLERKELEASLVHSSMSSTKALTWISDSGGMSWCASPNQPECGDGLPAMQIGAFAGEISKAASSFTKSFL